MKIFMLLVLAGQISGVTGPLPYGIEECEQRATAARAEILESGSKAVREGKLAEVPDLSVRCVLSERRPELNTPAD